MEMSYCLDTNLFYKYLQEYERDRVKEAAQRRPLEISLEDRSNNPSGDYIEAYEPQDNDGRFWEE